MKHTLVLALVALCSCTDQAPPAQEQPDACLCPELEECPGPCETLIRGLTGEPLLVLPFAVELGQQIRIRDQEWIVVELPNDEPEYCSVAVAGENTEQD